MDKDLTKMDQLRALREARSSRGGVESRPLTAVGLRDTLDRSGLKIPEAGVAPGPREAKFDRKTYQREYMREYMRKWRRTRNGKGGV